MTFSVTKLLKEHSKLQVNEANWSKKARFAVFAGPSQGRVGKDLYVWQLIISLQASKTWLFEIWTCRINRTKSQNLRLPALQAETVEIATMNSTCRSIWNQGTTHMILMIMICGKRGGTLI
jgi:hypothetical protein